MKYFQIIRSCLANFNKNCKGHSFSLSLSKNNNNYSIVVVTETTVTTIIQERYDHISLDEPGYVTLKMT